MFSLFVAFIQGIVISTWDMADETQPGCLANHDEITISPPYNHPNNLMLSMKSLSTIILLILPNGVLAQLFTNDHTSNSNNTFAIRHVNEMVVGSSWANSEGAWYCMTNTFQRCASGKWSTVMDCAPGTVCKPEGLTYESQSAFGIVHPGVISDATSRAAALMSTSTMTTVATLVDTSTTTTTAVITLSTSDETRPSETITRPTAPSETGVSGTNHSSTGPSKMEHILSWWKLAICGVGMLRGILSPPA